MYLLALKDRVETQRKKLRKKVTQTKQESITTYNSSEFGKYMDLFKWQLW